MASQTRTIVTQTYEGMIIRCAQFIVEDEAEFKMVDVFRQTGEYIFQAVLKASGQRTITLRYGNNITFPITIGTEFAKYTTHLSEVDTSNGNNDLYINFPVGCTGSTSQQGS